MKQRESDDEPVLGKRDSNSEWSDSDLLADSDLLEFETDMAELPKTELVTVDSKKVITYSSNGNDRDVLRASHTCQGEIIIIYGDSVEM